MFGKNAKVSFDKDNLFLCTENNKVFVQPLSDYPILKKATAEQKTKWKLSNVGIRWEEIDEDISFDSFLYVKNDSLVVKMR
ncbi:MAG: DUF2442 domain-containing protein [Chitinivibrionia bacterium]|nr:DUF2442 domain-containing protein [Chitinivibrionia bacterium]